MYAVTFFSVGCGVAAGEEGACELKDGARDADGWRGWAARVGLNASDTPKIVRRTKTAPNLWFAKFVVLFSPRAILEPVRNISVVCFE